MRILAFAIGAALAGPTAPDSSLQSQPPASTSTPAKPSTPAEPGPEVMKPLPVVPDLCLTGRCASV